jgi:hypothetical protein
MAQATCTCGGTRVVGNDLLALLGNRTVCAAVGNESWQEFHTGNTNAGGPLIDYKKGPNDRVDPSEPVGSWSIAANRVTYNYGAGGTYVYDVCAATGNTVNFCGGSRNVTGATVRDGQVACSGTSAAQLLRSSTATATR